MAQLNDSVISGNLRVTDTILANTLQTNTIDAPIVNDYTHFKSSIIAYGTCSTAADLRIKAVTISDSNWVRTVGGIIAVKFSNTNTYSSTADSLIKLSVNGVEAEIYYSNTGVVTGANTNCFGYANRYIYYMWDGTYWVWLNHCVDNNSTYTPQSLGFGYGTCSTAAATTAKVATLGSYKLVTNGIVSIKFTYDVPASATLNINSQGAKNIYYKGAAITAGVIKAGNVATFVYSSQYHLISIDSNAVGTGLTVDTIILGNGNSLIKTSSKTIATSITNVDTTVPTSKAVKTYVDGIVGNINTVLEGVL